ncbi:MAG: DUF503 domain-containing protein [candidate division WOR-3 bacterium]
MSVGLLVVDCHIATGYSLKDKRRVLLALTKKLRENFNVSIAETNYQNLWQRTELSIALVNTNYKEIERNYEKIIEFIQKDPRLRVLNYETTLLY